MNIKKNNSKRGVKYWLSVIPGTRLEYFLLALASVDVFVLMFGTSYIRHLPDFIPIYILAFDYFVIFIWALFSLLRIQKSEDKVEYIKTHWYEFLGLVPLAPLRIFLLLRAVKLAIVYYKLGRSQKDVAELRGKDFTFRFRDVAIDTIADVVFLQSLRRVEEVMSRLDYNKLAGDVLSQHEGELRKAICDNIESNSIVGDLSRVPLIGPITRGLGNNAADAVIDLMQQRVLGEIFSDITKSILNDMNKNLKELDLVRITHSTHYKINRSGIESEVESSKE